MKDIYECKGCGSCCRTIRLDPKMTPEFLLEQSQAGNEDAKFICNYWHPLDSEKMLKLRPDAEFPELVKMMGHGTWWSCTMFNHETNRCKSYDARPNVCKGYPFYGRMPHYFSPYNSACGYYRDCFPKEEFGGMTADIILVDEELAESFNKAQVKKTG